MAVKAIIRENTARTGPPKGPNSTVSMEPSFELPISVPPRGSRDRLRALHRQLRTAIVEGRLKPGVRLPPTRAFAAAHGVSRNTAVATYDLLLSEGYLTTRRGAGTYVADVLPKLPERKAGTTPSQSKGDRRITAFWREPPVLPSTRRVPVPFDFQVGLPDRSLFPFDVWRRLSARALRTSSRARDYAHEPQGRDTLREAIARHVSFARAVACGAEDIVVTAGAQQAFDLLARILVTPRKTVVALENPGYSAIRAIFEASGARVTHVPVDEEGLIVERIPPQAKVICVTPSHQFPLGVAMSSRRRAALLEVAQKHGAVVIEDDYDAEFRFGARPLDALQTLDRAESVFYVGTFTKSLFPGIRLGFIVAPSWARDVLVAAKQCADWTCTTLSQDVLAGFIAEGHLARHVRKMRQIYAQRREVLLTGLQKDFARWLEPIPAAAGLHLTTFARPGVNADAIVQRAEQSGVRVHSLAKSYSAKPSRSGLIFGYGIIDEHGIQHGLQQLRKVFRR
jgi:GntR family transcriptional regulator / MocR family aminotransferase